MEAGNTALATRRHRRWRGSENNTRPPETLSFQSSTSTLVLTGIVREEKVTASLPVTSLPEGNPFPEPSINGLTLARRGRWAEIPPWQGHGPHIACRHAAGVILPRMHVFLKSLLGLDVSFYTCIYFTSVNYRSTLDSCLESKRRDELCILYRPETRRNANPNAT